MTKNTAIKVQNLTKTYKLYDKPIDRLKESLHPLKKKYHRDFYALNDVSFEIKKGETVGIVGKNGSGKSTLLKIITGVLTPTSGKVSVHGKISAILELGAGFNPEMTGLENVYLNTSINGMSKKETDSKIKEIVEFAELGEFINQPVKTYSSGMKARLAFSVSISVEPDILIVDEALSVGDAAFARKCFAKMEEIRSRGATILFVSHSEGSVVALCNRAIWISNGKQIIDGTPKLVTGLYMKHINETKIDKAEIEKEYESLSKGEVETKKEEDMLVSESQSTIDNRQSTNSIDEFYNPALKPTSTICYEEKGAKISDIKITTLDGREVNVLVQGGEYILSHKVDFAEKNNNVILGISLHTKQGVILVNGHFPEQKKYHIINAKNVFVEWKFSCTVLEGEYFLTLGVMGIDNKFMARIKDAYMFKVINNQNRQMRGLIDLNLKGNIEIC
ncbi:ABC transporter ATP-binding protein [Sulfurimonas crateris]|uniref:ABC transporter ATP-binding protein n=1 Tax=Sulfurimonas crateris TaxID=2574727 RepID=A0A4U2Z7S0_9BACT|nr:ABC transporter ATP-binding protein [Sulfurimonas crateris]TKI69925.1 ABC transporter ATP-binding protein [Sulfurimonas crateris]